MRKYSEIKWSEFVRKSIQHRLDDLEKIEKHPHKECIFTMLASEEVLRKDWENRYDDRWDGV